MEIIFYSIDGIGKVKICGKDIIVEMDKETKLYRRIIRKLQTGFPVLSEFKNKGIPGKIKSYRNYRSYEDIVSLLNTLKKLKQSK